MIRWLVLVAFAASLVGCTTQSSDNQKSKAEEFSGEGFEQEMIKAGKQDELDAAKEREAEYLAAQGGAEAQAQEGGGNVKPVEGPKEDGR